MTEKVIVHQEYAGYSEVFKPYGSLDDVPSDDDVPDPIGKVWQAGPIQAALKSANGASVVLDLPLPPASDVDDDGEFYKLPRVIRGVSSALAKTGDDRFVKCLATIRRVFAGHDEEMADAIEIVTKIRAEARAEAVAL